MIVKVVKVKGKSSKQHIVLKPKTKRDKRVVNAIALATANVPTVLGTSLGDAQILLRVIPKPSLSEKAYKAALETYKEPPWNSIYETQQALILERKIADHIEYNRSLSTERIAAQYGLAKVIPKSIRARHICRCGVGYKKKSKLIRHQEFCAVLAEERENFANFEAAKKLMESETKRESQSRKKKTKQSTRQPVPDKPKSGKRKRKKAAKASS